MIARSVKKTSVIKLSLVCQIPTPACELFCLERLDLLSLGFFVQSGRGIVEFVGVVQ